MTIPFERPATPPITRDHIASIVNVLSGTTTDRERDHLRDVAQFLQLMLHTQEQLLLNFSIGMSKAADAVAEQRAPVDDEDDATEVAWARSFADYARSNEADEIEEVEFTDDDREFLDSLFFDVAETLRSNPEQRHQVQVLGQKLDAYLSMEVTLTAFQPKDFELLTATMNDAKSVVIAKETPDIRGFLESYLTRLRGKLSYEFGQEI